MKTFTLNMREALQDVYAIVLLIVASVALPFVFHAIPLQSNLPLGAIFLPIYYAPLIGVILFKKRVGLITALLVPIVNHIITGRPAAGMVLLLSLEMILFLGFYSVIPGRTILKNIIRTVLSYVLSVFLCIVVFGLRPWFIEDGTRWMSFMQLIRVSIPGILMLCSISLALNKYKETHD